MWGQQVRTEMGTAPGFTVEPREGTLTGPGGSIRLEPKVMAVLIVLARQRDRVVSREELLDEVWPGAVVTDYTLSRCIYQLRNALSAVGNAPDRLNYRPIETLPKRGYRLVAVVEVLASKTPLMPQEPSSELPIIPFVVGQWVRGERFYGRTAQIREILDGNRNSIWLLGTRRIGKTSLLKQIEYIASTHPEYHYFPVFWDFQGSETPEEFHLCFGDALLDAEERLEQLGIGVEDVQDENLFDSVRRLRRQLRSRKLKLLLLCDEVEELIKLHQEDPALLRKLRHEMQSRDDIRTVLASTIRLWKLADQNEDTSPFLHGFTPPLYIERFSDEEARSLIEQSHLGPEQRPRFSEGVVDAIRVQCDNHPYLLQLVCKRFLEVGSLDEAIELVRMDRMVGYFFSVDFEMLSTTEREILHGIARESVGGDAASDLLPSGSVALEGALHQLQNLGFIRRTDGRRYVLSNPFFRRWLEQAAQA